MDIIQIPTTQNPGAGLGDVVGPASATDNAIVRYDATTGRLLQNSTVTIADSTGAIAGATSLTSPAATNLTLGTTDSGAAITVLSASNNVGVGVIAPAYLLDLQRALAGSASAATPMLSLNALGSGNTVKIRLTDNITSDAYITHTGAGAAANQLLGFGINGVQAVVLNGSGNFLIGTTDQTGLTGAGGLKINSSTAGAANAGALVVTGGLSAGAASYFGGAVTAVGDLFGSYSASGAVKLTNSNGIGGIFGYSDAGTTTQWYIASDATNLLIGTGTALPVAIRTNGVNALTISTTQAATFAGAVAIGNSVAVGVAVASTHKVTMVIGGVTYYLLASNV